MTPAERLETQSALLLAHYRALLRELREANKDDLTPQARGILAHVECEGGLPYWIAG